jgi:hypothetical protein
MNILEQGFAFGQRFHCSNIKHCISTSIHSYMFRRHTDGHNIQPSSHFAFMTLATVQQAHAELPEDGACEAPKHVGVN